MLKIEMALSIARGPESVPTICATILANLPEGFVCRCHDASNCVSPIQVIHPFNRDRFIHDGLNYVGQPCISLDAT